jgi:hypothetical protein
MGRRTRKAPIQIMGTGTPILPARQKRRQRSARLQVELSQDEIAAVDEFRYRARMPSRAAAVRELLRRALVSVEEGRLTTLNEQGELPVLEWITVSGLIQVHRGPRPQGAPAQPLRRGFIVLASLRCRRRRAPWLAAYRRRSSPRCWRRTCSPPRRRPASMMAKMTRRQTA